MRKLFRIGFCDYASEMSQKIGLFTGLFGRLIPTQTSTFHFSAIGSIVTKRDFRLAQTWREVRGRDKYYRELS